MGSEDEKAAAKKDVEDDIDKTVAKKPSQKTAAKPDQMPATAPVAKEKPKSGLVDYSGVGLKDLVSLSTVLDAGLVPQALR